MDWRDYQEQVAELFRQIGASAQTNETVEGARGMHALDVFVVFNLWGQKIVWVAECKFWKSAIPKEKVLTLQQIVQDIGADRGFLFSEKGFQSGAKKVTSNSNITLTSLEDLRETVKEDFYHAYLIKALQQINVTKKIVKDLWIDDLSNPILVHKNILLDDVISLDGTLLFLSLTIQKGFDKKFPIMFQSFSRGTITCKSKDGLIENINMELDEISQKIGKYSLIANEAKGQILKVKDEFISSVQELLEVGHKALFPKKSSEFEELRLVAAEKVHKVGRTSEKLKEISRGTIRHELDKTMRLLIDTIYLYLTRETVEVELWEKAQKDVLNEINTMQQLTEA